MILVPKRVGSKSERSCKAEFGASALIIEDVDAAGIFFDRQPRKGCKPAYRELSKGGAEARSREAIFPPFGIYEQALVGEQPAMTGGGHQGGRAQLSVNEDGRLYVGSRIAIVPQ